MYTYKEVTTVIKKSNLMNFKLDNHLNKSTYVLNGYKAVLISGKPDKDSNYQLTVLYEKLEI